MNLAGRAVRPSPLRRLAWVLRDALFLAADRLALALCSTSAVPPQPDNVAIIAAHGIGDLVLLLPTLAALCARYARSPSSVTLICSTASAELAREFIDVGALIAVDRVRLRRDLAYRLRLMRGVRKRRFTVAIQPSFNRDLLVEDALVRASGAPLRIGSVGTDMFMSRFARRIGDGAYQRLVAAAPAPLHDLDRNAEFLCNLDPGSPPPAPLGLLPAEPRPTDPAYVLFAVGSSSPLKAWPLAHFQRVARDLAKSAGLPAVFCAGPDDAIAVEAKSGLVGGPLDPPHIGRTSLTELIGLIRAARLVVCNDSAASHLGAALGVPCVCIVGGGIVGRYHPYPPGALAVAPLPVGLERPMACFDCGWRCRFALRSGQAAPCVAAVEPEHVLAAALGLLQRPAAGAEAIKSL